MDSKRLFILNQVKMGHMLKDSFVHIGSLEDGNGYCEEINGKLEERKLSIE